MGFISLILDLAGVLIWFHWRSSRATAAVVRPGISLAGTLKRTGPDRSTRWTSLTFLALLLVFRAVFYWQIGPAVDWAPGTSLGAVTPVFRSDYLGRMFVFSILRFCLAIGGCYMVLLLVSSANQRTTQSDERLTWIRGQLGWIERWPVAVKLILPALVAFLFWLSVLPILDVAGVIPDPRSPGHRWQQALFLSLSGYLVLRFFLYALLLLHWINCYVYLGNYSFWSFVNITASQLLRPLQFLPMRIGKFDFAPILVLALVWGLSEVAYLILPHFYQNLPFTSDYLTRVSSSLGTQIKF